jgi:hypothetical protein
VDRGYIFPSRLIAGYNHSVVRRPYFGLVSCWWRADIKVVVTELRRLKHLAKKGGQDAQKNLQAYREERLNYVKSLREVHCLIRDTLTSSSYSMQSYALDGF